MIYAVNGLMDMLQYICFLYIFFKEQLMFSTKIVGIITGVYVLCLTIMLLLHQEQNLLVVSTIMEILLTVLFLKERWYEKILSF